VTGFEVVRSRSDAATFHAQRVPEPARAALWWHEVTRPALVLGSNQDDAMVDRGACARAGVDVVRRRSGGGAVLLVPGEVAWLDVILPRHGPGWSDDVHRPMVWFGTHLVAALAAAGVGGALDVHHGPMRTTPWSSMICFDGLGAGEVSRDGAKLVGISQRRTRGAARLQCCWYLHHDPSALVGLLEGADRPPVAALGPVATAAVTTEVLDELTRRLPGTDGGPPGE
jgi:lipoate-protein ligase A